MPTKTKKKFDTNQLRDTVTNAIIAQLEEAQKTDNVIPWTRPWSTPQLHANLLRHKKQVYRGINQWLCEIACMQYGFTSPFWLTYDEATKLGARVKKINAPDEKGTGQKQTIIVFKKRILVDDYDKLDENGKPTKKTIWLLRYHRVYNIDQLEGIPEGKIPEPPKPRKGNVIRRAKDAFAKMPDKPKLTHGGSDAFYAPPLDMVRLPEPENFDSPEAYFSVKSHEYVHSTGHKKRLNRALVGFDDKSDPRYAKEELTAQLGAAMLCKMYGVQMPIQYDAGYVKSWLKALKNDNNLVIAAGTKAHAAVDYIAGITYNNNESESNNE